MYRVPHQLKKNKTKKNNEIPPPKKNTKTEPINIFITSTKIKQNNSNFLHSNFWPYWWILWSQFFMHKIYFISCKKEKARIKFMNFSQKYMGSVFFFCGGGHPVQDSGWGYKAPVTFTKGLQVNSKSITLHINTEISKFYQNKTWNISKLKRHILSITLKMKKHLQQNSVNFLNNPTSYRNKYAQKI